MSAHLFLAWAASRQVELYTTQGPFGDPAATDKSYQKISRE